MKKVFLTLVMASLATIAFAGDPGAKSQDRANFATKIGEEPTKVVETFSERVPGVFDLEAYEAEMRQTYEWLANQRVAGSDSSAIIVSPSNEDFDRMSNYNCEDCGTGGKNQKLMVGVNLTTAIPMDLTAAGRAASRAPSSAGTGMIQAGENGGYIWSAVAESIGATAVRIHFTDVKIPDNASFYVYNDLGEVAGPYGPKAGNTNGEIWSAAISGPNVYIQLHAPAGAPAGMDTAQFTINQIAHLGEDFKIPGYAHGGQSRAFCSFNASCVVDASCHTGVSAVNDARGGVAHILFSVGSSQFICSGGLLNDTDTTTQIPLFLTANHCLSTSASASSTQFYWQFATSSCGAACFSRTLAPSTTGASLLATSSTSDYTLMQCNQAPPSGSIFMGWTSAAVANSNGTPLYRISHPKGAPQAYSQHNVSTTAGTCGSWPRGGWIYSKDQTGATEGGSSGSPVVNASGQVVGQLSGACGTNPSNPCATSSNATVDGALANYFSSVSSYLNPGTGGGCNNNGFVGTAGPLSGTSSFWGSSFQYFTVSVPANTCTLTVAMSGGTGDADLYVRFGANPTTSTYDCRPYLNGNNETCTFSNPQAGTWHIGINAFSNYSGVNLTVTH